jgi:hypothetical protein
MTPPPIAHHLGGNLAGIAERLRFRLDDFVPPLARPTVRVFRLVLAYTPTAVMRLTLLHNALPNLLSVSCRSDSGFTLGRFGSTSGAAYEFSVSMVISKVIAAILMLLFRRRDSAA